MSYSFATVFESLTEARQTPKQLFTPYYYYETLGAATRFDGGGCLYKWHPESYENDDNAFVVRPSSVSIVEPGRLIAQIFNGIFSLAAAGIDNTGQSPVGMRIMELWKKASAFGAKYLQLPPGDFDVRDWVGDFGDVRVQGIANCGLIGAGVGKTRLRTYVSMIGELATPVRLATQAQLPSFSASGSGVGKTLTMTANGQCGVDNEPLGTIASVGASSITMNPTATSPVIVYFSGLTINPGDVIMFGSSGNVGATVLNANPATGLVNFTGARPSGFAPAGSAYRAKLVAAGDRILNRHGPNYVDNGPYLCTQQGDAAHPCILTRATDFDTSAAMTQRLGVRTTDGSTGTRLTAYVLSALPNQYYSTAAMTMDVSPQYWTSDLFIGASLTLWPTAEQEIFRYPVPAYPPTHWTERVGAGQLLMHNVQWLNGGDWVDPDNGTTYHLTAINPGDKTYIKCAGTPTDQGQWWNGYIATVVSVNKTTGDVLLDVPSQERNIMVSSAGTPGAYDSYNPLGRWKIGQISAVGANQFTLSPAYLAGGYVVGESAYVSTSSTGGTYRAGAGIVASTNASTGVVTVNPGTLPAGTVPGDYAFHQYAFPYQSQQRATEVNDNVYVKVTALCENVEIADITFDGVSLNLGFVENLYIHDIAIENVHVGCFFSGCRGTLERWNLKNVSGYSFPNEVAPSPLCWYGWAYQFNFSKIVWRDFVFDGISSDVCDQEGESECYGHNVVIKLKNAPVPHSSLAISATTPNCIRLNPIDGLTVYGSISASPTLTQPAHNLNWSAVDVPNGYRSGFGGASTASFTGLFTFKGRRYDMGRRRQWRFLCPVTGPATRIIRRPWQGLWANTKLYAPSVTGWTSFSVGPNYIGSVDLISIVQQNFIANKWFQAALDDLYQTYPNATDDELQSITLVTDGTVPAGSYLILETECIQEIDRGDGYSGVSDGVLQIPPLAGYQIIRDSSIPLRLYGTGSPVGVVQPDFPGQEFQDRTTPALYQAYDVLNSTQWKQVW